MSKNKVAVFVVLLVISITVNIVLLLGYLREREQLAAYEREITEEIDLQLTRVLHFLGPAVQTEEPLPGWRRLAYEAAFTAGSLSSILLDSEASDVEDWMIDTFPNRIGSIESAEEASRIRDKVYELVSYLRGAGVDPETLEKEGKGFAETKQLFIIRMKRQ